jgi:hypothetical protein
MCSAIAECHKVDEVLSVKDKARALEIYAQQVKNTEAERKACEVRVRAERRVGELLRQLQRATPSDAGVASGIVRANAPHAAERSPYARALTDNAISTQSASRYQRLAAVPAAKFEAAMNGERKPTTASVIDIAQAADNLPPMRDEALWIWGRMREFERGGYGDCDPRVLLDGMTETMQRDVRRIAPAMVDFFGALVESNEHA